VLLGIAAVLPNAPAALSDIQPLKIDRDNILAV
jgi:hypothetical protein